MGRYLIHRLIWAVFTVWGLATSVFFLLRLFPGGPFDDDLALRPEIKIALEKLYRVSGSGWDHYTHFLWSCLQGDLGISLYFIDQSVGRIILRGWETTFWLNFGALAAALIFSLILGILPHLWPGAARSLRELSRLSLALPNLFLAPLMLWLLCFHFSVFPLRADGSAWSMTLPILLLAFRPSFALARLLDLKIQDAHSQPYSQVHQAMGVGPVRLILRWLLRISVPAYLQQWPATAAGLLSGSLLIEVLFSIQGLGMQFTDALLNRDWPLALGLTLFFGVMIVVFQILADLALLWLDPRVRIT